MLVSNVIFSRHKTSFVFLVVVAVVYKGACSRTSDCEANKGLECRFPYSTCNEGECACSEGSTYDANDEICKTGETILLSVTSSLSSIPSS